MTDTRDWSVTTDEIPPDSRQNTQPGWQAEYRAQVEDGIAIPRAVLEKIYLSPPTDVRGDLRNIFANPTPLGLVGFLVATFPVSFQLMQIAGSGGGGAATAGLGLYFGGVLQLIACVMEWILGNTFSFLLFGTFGCAWFALATAGQVEADFVASLAGNNPTEAARAAAEFEFYASFAFGLLTFGFLIVIFGLCALRTNLIFVVCFATVSFGIFLFAASYWCLAQGKAKAAREMQVAVGAIFFFCCLLAWYLLVANLLEVLEFDMSLPVGDLSGKMGGRRPSYRDRSKSV